MNSGLVGYSGILGSVGEEALLTILRAYRILLTRAIEGFGVWFQDPEARAHVLGALHQ